MAHDDADTIPSTPADATEAVWRQRFADQQASGLSVRAWCASHGVPERQFHRRRLALLGPRRTPPAPRPATPRPTPTRTAPASAFVPLHLTAEPTADIALPSGVVVTIPLTADPAHVTRLLAAVRSC
jgi:hypothetical protein